jgi:pyruvate formate lyase activating enzyme
MADASGVIFDIQHFSVHDGPGIRSTIFLKGCPLACKWCSNPESQSRKPQLLFFSHLCTACGACVEACPNRAVTLDDGTIRFHRSACTACGTCAAVCQQNARTLSGRIATVEEICTEVRQHWRIFAQSGGGITCGGGEALAQPAFLRTLLHNLHEELGFHTCLDTTAHAPWDVLESLLPSLDLILLDLKHMDGATHKKATGKANDLILQNAARLGEGGFPVVVRLPLIPSFNDTDDNAHALGGFMRDVGLRSLEILPYHEFSLTKYAALGRRFTAYPRTDLRLAPVESILRSYGLDLTIHQR